jgi:hypothetical protein
MFAFFFGVALWAVLLKGITVFAENRRLTRKNIELEKSNFKLRRHNEALRELL